MSVQVLADDGLFYTNPVLCGPGWFVCFDDVELPELVIDEQCVGTDASPEEVRSHMAAVIDRAGIQALIMRGPSRMVRIWGDDVANSRRRMSRCAHIDVYAPPPARLIRDGCGQRQPGPGVAFDFNYAWG